MSVITDFIKKILVGGIFVLLPLLIFYFILSELFELVVGLATPIAALLPEDTFANLDSPVVAAIALLVGVSALIGVVMLSKTGRVLGKWLEAHTVGNLPAYLALKRLFSGFGYANKDSSFTPALLEVSEGEKHVCYVIEEINEAEVTVLLPVSPTPFVGTLRIVAKSKIQMLDISMSDFSVVVNYWGVGLKKVLAAK